MRSPAGWTFHERVPTAAAPETRVHLLEPPKAVATMLTICHDCLANGKPMEKQTCYLPGIIKIEGLIVQRK